MHADMQKDEFFTGLFNFARRNKQLPYFDDQCCPSKIDDRDISLGWLTWGPWEEYDRWCFGKHQKSQSEQPRSQSACTWGVRPESLLVYFYFKCLMIESSPRVTSK